MQDAKENNVERPGVSKAEMENWAKRKIFLIDIKVMCDTKCPVLYQFDLDDRLHRRIKVASNCLNGISPPLPFFVKRNLKGAVETNDFKTKILFFSLVNYIIS